MLSALVSQKEKRSMRMIWKTLRLRHLGLAFFWACSMLTFRSTHLLESSINTPENQTFIIIVSFALNAATLFGLSFLIEKDRTRYEQLPAWAFASSIILGLVTLFFSGSFGPQAVIPLIAIGSILTGIGYGYFWGSWAEVYGKMHPSRTSFYIPAAFLLTTIIFLCLSIATDYFGIPAILLMIPLPIITFGCLTQCRKEPDLEPAKHTGRKVYFRAFGSLWSLVLASLVLTCLFGLIWEITVFSVGSVNEAHHVPLQANSLVAIALLGLVLFTKTRIDIGLVYRIIVPVIVLVLISMPFFWTTEAVALNTVMSAAYGAFDVILWYAAVSTAYDFSVSGFVVGSFLRIVAILSRLFGIFIGYIIMQIPDSSTFIIVTICLGAIYALGMLFILNSGKKKLTVIKEELAEPSEPQDTKVKVCTNCDKQVKNLELEQVCDLVAEDYGLTRRESEVLPYLARGRSAKVIASSLFVSENTVRTHIRNILEKTDLSDKQGIIDLIERYH